MITKHCHFTITAHCYFVKSSAQTHVDHNNEPRSKPHGFSLELNRQNEAAVRLDRVKSVLNGDYTVCIVLAVCIALAGGLVYCEVGHNMTFTLF